MAGIIDDDHLKGAVGGAGRDTAVVEREHASSEGGERLPPRIRACVCCLVRVSLRIVELAVSIFIGEGSTVGRNDASRDRASAVSTKRDEVDRASAISTK